jgi:hypothetical protein
VPFHSTGQNPCGGEETAPFSYFSCILALFNLNQLEPLQNGGCSKNKKKCIHTNYNTIFRAPNIVFIAYKMY